MLSWRQERCLSAMSLEVHTVCGPTPEPATVSAHELAAWARHVQNPWAHRPDLASVTVPRLTDDQSGLEYERRGHKDSTEFRFAGGVLSLELTQRIYLVEGLSPEAAQAWLAHETLHLRDHEAALGRLEGELRRDPILRAVFVERRWWQAGWIHQVRATVREGVAAVFWRLASAASMRRDTQAAFRRVQRAIATHPTTQVAGEGGQGTEPLPRCG